MTQVKVALLCPLAPSAGLQDWCVQPLLLRLFFICIRRSNRQSHCVWASSSSVRITLMNLRLKISTSRLPLCRQTAKPVACVFRTRVYCAWRTSCRLNSRTHSSAEFQDSCVCLLEPHKSYADNVRTQLRLERHLSTSSK